MTHNIKGIIHNEPFN